MNMQYISLQFDMIVSCSGIYVRNGYCLIRVANHFDIIGIKLWQFIVRAIIINKYSFFSTNELSLLYCLQVIAIYLLILIFERCMSWYMSVWALTLAIRHSLIIIFKLLSLRIKVPLPSLVGTHSMLETKVFFK